MDWISLTKLCQLFGPVTRWMETQDTHRVYLALEVIAGEDELGDEKASMTVAA
jgi:hypothetical protein